MELNLINIILLYCITSLALTGIELRDAQKFSKLDARQIAWLLLFGPFALYVMGLYSIVRIVLSKLWRSL